MANRNEREFSEPEEMRETTVDVDFNPLNEQVNEKVYSQPNINASTEELNRPISEPSFTPPPLNKKPQFQAEQPKREPVNPEMRNLPKKETQAAASQMAKIIIDSYESMHGFGNKFIQISEKKLNKLQADGEINLNAEIDYDYGKKIRAGDFINEYNQQVGTTLTVSDEFKEQVTPILERVLAKRGIGMTDEQSLIFLFGKDIATKGMLIVQQKQQGNYMIQSIREATMNQYAPPPPPMQPRPTPTPPPPPPPPAPEYSQQTESYQEPQAEVKKEGLKPDMIVMPKRQRGRPRL